MEDKIFFKNREEAEKFLVGLLRDLNKKDEFNIYVHQIWRHSTWWDRGEGVVERRVEGIMSSGLDGGDYCSIFGTTKFACSSKDLDANPILNYDYHHDSTLPTCIISIPKYVEIDGKKVEYSSYKSNTDEALKEVQDAYRERWHVVDGHHQKSNLFDVVKGMQNIPKYYTLGIIQKDGEGYSFINSPENLRFATQEEYKNYQQKVAGIVKSAYERYSTQDPLTLMIESCKKEITYLEDKMLEYD